MNVSLSRMKMRDFLNITKGLADENRLWAVMALQDGETYLL